MKTKEELNKLKDEVDTVSRKLTELSDDELEQVTAGANIDFKMLRTLLGIIFAPPESMTGGKTVTE